MRDMVDRLTKRSDIKTDCTQIFVLDRQGDQQRIIHTQENPEYRQEYLYKTT